MEKRNYKAFDDKGRAIGIRFDRREKSGYDKKTKTYASLESIGYTAYFTKEVGCIRISCKGINVYAREDSNGGIKLSYKVQINGYEADDATLVSDKAKGNFNAVKKYLLGKYNFKDMKYTTLESNLIEALRDKYASENTEVSAKAC